MIMRLILVQVIYQLLLHAFWEIKKVIIILLNSIKGMKDFYDNFNYVDNKLYKREDKNKILEKLIDSLPKENYKEDLDEEIKKKSLF